MITLEFSNNTNGEPVYVSCNHKKSKQVMSYLVKIIKDLNLSKRPNMLLKKDEGLFLLKICSISKKELEELELVLSKRSYKFNEDQIQFIFKK